MEEMVDSLLPELLEHIDRPFAMFGHCLGAIVMYEVALALRERHALRPVHMFASGASAPSRYLLPAVDPERAPEEGTIDLLAFIGFASPALLADREAIAELLPPVVGDFMIAADYKHRPPATLLDVPITTFAARDDYIAPPDLVELWKDTTTEAFSKVVYAGEHYFIGPERSSIVRIVVDDMLHHAAVRDAIASPPPVLSARPEARRILLCIPGAMSEASMYRAWPAALPDDVEVIAVDLPGRGARAGELPLRRVDAIVDWLLRAVGDLLDRPFSIVGHALGAVIAFELTRRLRRERRPLPEHLIVCAAMAPQVYSFPPIHHHDAERFQSTLGRLRFGARDDVSETAARADVSAMHAYVCRPEAPLAVPITAFMAEGDALVPREGLRAWRAQAGASFALHVLPGDHGFVRGEDSPVLPVVREVLDRDGDLLTASRVAE
jgi:surfactin synthase thioesterase subunit